MSMTNMGLLDFHRGIEEKYSDFTQRFKTRQICDPGQWIYEEFTPPPARWTYILTNEDYERAKINFGKMVGIIFYPDKQIVSPENLS